MIDDKAETVFLIGAPRSGTTWVQNMLGTHPRVATPQETELFSLYVAPWQARWDQQLAEAPRMRYKGLPVVLSNEQFEDWIKTFVESVFSKVLEEKPGANVLLEKTPMHSLLVPLIHKYLPKARFLHLIRDGRAVTTSLNRVSASWGTWAPSTVAGAAQLWDKFTSSARSASSITDNYYEVRYEDLLKDGSALLQEVFSFCTVDVSAEECQRILDQFSTNDSQSSIVWSGEIRQRYPHQIEEPEGFVTSKRGRAPWTPRDRWAFRKAAGDLLVELGYEKDHSWTRLSKFQEILLSRRARLKRISSRLARALARMGVR